MTQKEMFIELLGEPDLIENNKAYWWDRDCSFKVQFDEDGKMIYWSV